MAEVISQIDLSRNLRIRGCLRWNQQNRCLLAMSDGMMIFELTIRPTSDQEKLNVGMPCINISLNSEAREPLGLNRQRLNARVTDHSDLAQQTKLDRVLCPAIRSMGDILAIRQAYWEPFIRGKNTRLAILTQGLQLYDMKDGVWEPTLYITKLLYKHLQLNPVKNNTEDFKAKFDVHCQHVMFMCWTQIFERSDVSEGEFSYIIVTNKYNHLFAVRIPASRKEESTVQRLEIESDSHISGISALQWVETTVNSGMLVIGQRDGSCLLLTYNSDLQLQSHKELELDKDYRMVEQISSIGDDEMMFVKHNQLFIYNTRTGLTQSHVISETKYSLINVTADKTHIYIATTDMGFLIKSRHDGSLVQSLTDPLFSDSCALTLSPSGLLLLTVSKTPLFDMYQYQKPLSLKLIRLQPINTALENMWESSADINWDHFIIIAKQIEASPDWLIRYIDDTGAWPSLTHTQLRILYITFHCLLVLLRSLEDANEQTNQRQKRFTHLKLMLTSQRLTQLQDCSQLLDHVSKCMKMLSNNGEVRDVSAVPQCPICDEVFSLNYTGIYRCSNGHSFEMCSTTAKPVLCVGGLRCALCTSPVCDTSDIADLLLVNDRCSYCGGTLQNNDTLL